MAPRFCHLMSSGSRENEPRCGCLIGAKASHRQRMWAEVSPSATHPAQWAVRQPHQVEVPTQGIVPGKKSGNHPGLWPIEGQKSRVILLFPRWAFMASSRLKCALPSWVCDRCCTDVLCHKNLIFPFCYITLVTRRFLFSSQPRCWNFKTRLLTVTWTRLGSR
jgi:hypothetical protein